MKPNSILIKSIYEKKNFKEFKELGFEIVYHDDSGPKDHFEESEWLRTILLVFGIEIVRDLLKDAAKSGLKKLISVTSSKLKVLAKNTIYRLQSR